MTVFSDGKPRRRREPGDARLVDAAVARHPGSVLRTRHFVDCLRNGTEPETSGTDSLKTYGPSSALPLGPDGHGDGAARMRRRCRQRREA